MEDRTMLALNMIVGKDDHNELDRCLNSVDLKQFNEIVIVRTDPCTELLAVCEKYTTKHYFKEWASKEFPYGDFGGARNLALEMTKSKFIMWLDADDILTNDVNKTIPKIKENLHNCDYDLLSADYHLFENGSVSRILSRVRFFRRETCHWVGAVHEQVRPIEKEKHLVVDLKGFYVTHKKIKPHELSIDRNLEILSHELVKNPDDSNIKLNYGNELLSFGGASKNKEIIDKSFKLLKECLNYPDEEIHPINKVMICISIAMQLLYGKNLLYNISYSIDKKDLKIAENFVRIGMSFDEYSKFAELSVMLGDIYIIRGLATKALNFYNDVKGKKFDGIGTQNTVFYGDIPACRSLYLCYEQGWYEAALWYSNDVLKYHPKDKEIFKLRLELLEKIKEKDSQCLNTLEQQSEKPLSSV